MRSLSSLSVNMLCSYWACGPEFPIPTPGGIVPPGGFVHSANSLFYFISLKIVLTRQKCTIFDR